MECSPLRCGIGSTKELVLARDRLGIKPLYYGWLSNVFWFGSELKALRCLRPFEQRLNIEALGLFFRYGYIPAPHSIFKGIFKLPPAHFVLLKSASDQSVPECYWPLVRDFSRGGTPVFAGTRAEARDELDRLLRQSIRGQMVSDVPLGAFLSGGIDSSTVVALMQAQSTRAVKTFTIGFEESGFNEAECARAVAGHLHTDHTDMTLTAREAQAIVPCLGEMFDEPFADSSQIPTFAVSRLTRQHVTVSLSGDGGDELFAGYRHYALCANRLRQLGKVSSVAGRFISAGARALSERGWDRILSVIPAMPARAEAVSGFKIHKYASLLAQNDSMTRYDLVNARWFAPGAVVRGAVNGLAAPQNGLQSKKLDVIELMAATDLNHYLPDDILTKVDRASMAVSLESRVPLLDHEVVAFALSLPLPFKRSNGEGKQVLRQVLEKYVPRQLFERPKKGFSVPVSTWIRGPLRDWAESLLERGRREHSELLNTEVIDTKWGEHLSGKRNWEELLWPVLMFETWAETNL